ncbi:MAG: hypothetical protein A2W28_01290 [Gammaproteobacteria bacterium RBG_16_51_14]|nr:MAG: hypothetical protein A2W28_01290 [Gammaproteobacteria bacterium RBG_16_51_14]
MIYFLVTGAVLGISAGLAPGPLLALVVTETLKHGIRTGVRVALVPVCTDLPIIFLIPGLIFRINLAGLT